MKKTILSLLVALAAAVTVEAQQIAVVSKSGSTAIYQTLVTAIEGAEAESVIYLPGGGFPVADSVKINKRLTIIGIGHNSASDNTDGRTLIAGNLFFEKGSDGSAVMGCYVDGNVNVGTSADIVDNILVKYCNINSLQVNNKECVGTIVNQCYVRGTSNCNYAKVDFTNNIMHSLYQVNGGKIDYNVVTSYYSRNGYYYIFYSCNDCTFDNNVILSDKAVHSGGNCQATGNMLKGRTWGDESTNVSDEWAKVFKNNAGVNPVSNYEFTEAYAKYNGVVGITGGDGFSKGALPPVPYIAFKSIPGQTDAAGKLNIKIAVKAGATE